ncbi:hypothetical protein LQW54_010339 [Pestalotiopsis sp. IQ-011]
MAGNSPTRRSSRARTTQPQPQLPSAASSLSGRGERSSRSLVKAGSPQKSSGTGSLSSEPPEDSTATTASSDDNPLLRRRSTRNREEDRDKENKQEPSEMAIVSDENEIQEDDEAVRCVCGYDDYPGLPLLDEESKNHALKDAIDVEQIFSIELTDDLAGFFVQCDVCKVWEHGLCMGIVNEDLIPDDYYCELCRKDLHKIYAASNGATSATKEGARSPKPGDRKSSRTSAAAAAAAAAQSMAKRRSTMNSRDAAYDEEQLRRAIEISQNDTITEEADGTQIRRPKRIRDDDDESPEIKRQRTNSKSLSPDDVAIASREESEDDSNPRNGALKKSSRNAARTQREKTEREERREEVERKRAEAANKRKGRAERRRADGNAVHFQAKAVPDPPPSSQPVPDTPPADQAPVASSKKKTMAQPKKKGRNQYTKDRDNHLQDDSPARSMSRDITRDRDESHTKHHHEGGPKHPRSKGAMNSKITMTDLKRRANNLMEFITRTQVELANEPLSERNSPRQPASEDGSRDGSASRPNGSSSKSSAERTATSNGGPTPPLKDFKELSCVEMMDTLTRDLVKWQQEFAS